VLLLTALVTMSFSHETLSTRAHTDRSRQARPSFSSHVTSDRLRESERASSTSVPRSKIKPQRRSVFREEGLDDVNSHTRHITFEHAKAPSVVERQVMEDEKPGVTFDHILKDLEHKNTGTEASKKGLFSILRGPRPNIKTAASAPPGSIPTVPRAALIVLLICVVVPGFRYSGGGANINGADAGVIRTAELVENGSVIEGRQDSPTSICTRWSHQTANVNGTLYIYGEL
jgi:hypothetical protein